MIGSLFHNQKYSKRFVCFACFLQMTFIAGFRYKVGTDYNNYTLIFQAVNNFGIANIGIEALEPGYFLINKLVGFLFGNNPIAMNFILASITMYLIIKVISENSADYFLSIYLFVSFCLFYNMMNQSRQALSIAIALYAIKYLNSGQNKKFVIWILIAASIHFSAIIMMILLFLSKIKVDFKVIRRYIIISIIAFININLIVNIIEHTKYSIYIGSKYDFSVGSTVILNMAVRLALLICVIFFMKRIKKNTYTNILYHMALLCTSFQLLAIKTALFGRLTTYFFIAYILLIPLILKSIKQKYIRALAYIAVFIIFGIYHYIYFTVMGGAMGIDVYNNIFFSTNIL